MGIIKRLKWKDKTGKTTDYDLGAKASNVEQDATHRFVSDTEKQTWNGKADPEDIPSGSAADYGVANNDTTNRTDMLVTAQVAYQHGKEIDQLNSETDRIQVYVGDDGKLHFVNKAGADSALPFSKGPNSGDLISQTSMTYYHSYDSSHSDAGATSIDCSHIAIDIAGIANHNGNVIAYNAEGQQVGSVSMTGNGTFHIYAEKIRSWKLNYNFPQGYPGMSLSYTLSMYI